MSRQNLKVVYVMLIATILMVVAATSQMQAISTDHSSQESGETGNLLPGQVPTAFNSGGPPGLFDRPKTSSAWYNSECRMQKSRLNGYLSAHFMGRIDVRSVVNVDVIDEGHQAIVTFFYDHVEVEMFNLGYYPEGILNIMVYKINENHIQVQIVLCTLRDALGIHPSTNPELLVFDFIREDGEWHWC